MFSMQVVKISSTFKLTIQPENISVLTVHLVIYRVRVFNASFNNIPDISWPLFFFLVELFSGVPGENHRLAASH